VHWDQLIWDQCKVASSEHASSKITHEWCCLEVEVTEHFVGTPSAEKADDVCVNVGSQ